MTTITKTTRKSPQARQDTVTGIIKPSGQICGHVINDVKLHYYTVINTDGTTSCTSYDPETGKREECKGHYYRHHCRHTDKTRAQAATFASYDELVALQDDPEPLPPAAIVETPDEDRTPVISIEEMIEWAEGQLGINPFEEVGDPCLEPPMTEDIVHPLLFIPVLASTQGNSCFYCGHLCKGDVCRGCSV